MSDFKAKTYADYQQTYSSPFNGYRKIESLNELMDGSEIIIVRESNGVSYVMENKITKYSNGEILCCSALASSIEDGVLKDNTNYTFKVTRVENCYALYNGTGYLFDNSNVDKPKHLNISTINNLPEYHYWNITDSGSGGYYFQYKNQSYLGSFGSPTSYISTSSSTNKLMIYVNVENNLNIFGENYLAMSKNIEGQCNDLYQGAKNQINLLGDRYKSCLVNKGENYEIYSRFEDWAKAKNDNDFLS